MDAVVRRWPALGFMSRIFIVGVAMAVILRFAWKPMLMALVLVGITSPAAMLGVIVGLVIVGAAALHARFAGRPFWR